MNEGSTHERIALNHMQPHTALDRDMPNQNPPGGQGSLTGSRRRASQYRRRSCGGSGGIETDHLEFIDGFKAAQQLLPKLQRLCCDQSASLIPSHSIWCQGLPATAFTTAGATGRPHSSLVTAHGTRAYPRPPLPPLERPAGLTQPWPQHMEPELTSDRLYHHWSGLHQSWSALTPSCPSWRPQLSWPRQ